MASSVASAPSTNVLITLPARPPTPPREASHEIDSSRKSAILGRPLSFDARLKLQTPPNAHSITSPATASDQRSSRVRKKVEWSAHTEYREAAQYPDGLTAHRPSPQSAPSSFSKPVKGILKPSPSPNPLALSLSSELDGPSSPLNIIEMLDSTIKQLAGSDRESKLDAYMMLSRALKASNNLPDRVALQNKMSLFMQFIQRDATAKSHSGSMDTSLVNHSLTLLATFLHFPAIASTLTTDFGIFMMDHSIRSFEDAAVPKDVVRHLMQVVAFQNFSAKVMTLERVGRLVAGLHAIENHVKGKSIIMSRLHIYKRLIKQARNHMANHTDWLKDMFTDMLSAVKDIRSQAITLGMEAGFSLRTEKQLLRRVTDIFQTTHDNETYIEFYIRSLQGMIKDKQSASAVPQVWSVVILFLRCPLDRWQYYGPWLTLAQSAFNMTDSTTKQEANFAWNRYVYLSLSDTKANPKAIGTLCQPLLSQLRRKSSPKQQEEAIKLRRAVVGGICNLYYYVFAPGNDKYTPDVLWDLSVQPVMSQLISLDGRPDIPGDGIMQAAKLLVGLLDVTTARVWRQDRIMDLPPVKPDELPAIDSKWVRKNCDKVLESVGQIIQKRFLDLANKDSLIYRLWQALVSSIKAASTKDIKVSEDTAKFVGCSFGLLSKVLTTDAPELGAAPSNSRMPLSVSNFVLVLIEGIGILPFTEKRLSMNISNTFEPISTPSHRTDQEEKPRGVVRMPLQHLFVMLSTIPPGDMSDDDLLKFFQSVFEPFLKGRSGKGRLDLTNELLQLLPWNARCSIGPWMFVADIAKSYLHQRTASPGATLDSEKLLGPEYRQIVSLLERGLSTHPNLPLDRWISLFKTVSSHISAEFGDAGFFLMVTDPLAKVLLDTTFSSPAELPPNLIIQAATTILSSAKLPRDKQALDAARSRLWGAPSTLSKTGLFDPFDSVCKVGNHFLSRMYNLYDVKAADWGVSRLIAAIDAFVAYGMSQLGVKFLAKIQTGIGPWIEDEKARFQTESPTSELTSVISLWDHICTELAVRGQSERQDLDSIEPLLTAGFKSSHSPIVNRTAAAWNALVQNEEDAVCSDSLASLISSIQSRVDVTMPGLSRLKGGFGGQAAQLVEPPISLSLGALSSISPQVNGNASATASPTNNTSKRVMTRKRRLEMATEHQQEQLDKRTRTPRLRHDNSQIQFKPIASSPLLEDESQHLTEHQKEVRERQRQNAVLYSDMQQNQSAAPQSSLPEERKGKEMESRSVGPDSTPKRGKSFEDLISLTPTPRRGLALQLDDLNDPPSSPPLPRPYPLLSEIQSRSRAGSAVENWEFSSPPGSPDGNRLTEEAELPPSNPARIILPMKTRRSSKRTRGSTTKDTGQADTIAAKDDSPARNRKAEAKGTKPEGVTTRAKKAKEATPKAENETAAVVRSASRRRSSRSSRQLENANKAAVSNSEESEAVENLTGERDMQGPDHAPGVMPESVPDAHSEDIVKSLEAQESAAALPDLSCASPGNVEMTTDAAASLPIPISPSHPTENVQSSGPKRKRKRGGTRNGNIRNKRRHSVINEALESASTKAIPSSPAPSQADADSQMEGMGTRSGLRRRQQQHEPGGEHLQTAIDIPKQQVKDARKPVDGGDTDEEVLSQLVTESNAASQQSHKGPEQDSEMFDVGQEMNANEGAMELGAQPSLNASMVEKGDAAEDAKSSVEGDKTLSIMENLRNGLEQLRRSSLTREKVYEVEDILMDMKRELFEAERRGRGRVRKRKSRGR